jgi:hypothetical protein
VEAVSHHYRGSIAAAEPRQQHRGSRAVHSRKRVGLRWPSVVNAGHVAKRGNSSCVRVFLFVIKAKFAFLCVGCSVSQLARAYGYGQ